MKIVFMGTPDFSATVLQKLNSVYPVALAISNPDRVAGRGYALKQSPLKEAAIRLGIPVFTFEKVSRDGIEQLRDLSPDVIVTAAFGQILSEELLSVPKYGVLNVHASLLPKLRGASPIQWAILGGEEETGVTVMRTVKEVDAGDILLKKRVKIGEEETAGELFDRLADLGGEAIVEAIALIESGKAVYTPQNGAEATHCSMIKKEDGLIDFSKSVCALDCFVRGMTPWPSAFTHLDGKLLKVYKIKRAEADIDEEALKDVGYGNVVYADAVHGLVVRVGDGLARLSEIQLEGAKRMKDIDFLRGRAVPTGATLR